MTSLIRNPNPKKPSDLGTVTLVDGQPEVDWGGSTTVESLVDGVVKQVVAAAVKEKGGEEVEESQAFLR